MAVRLDRNAVTLCDVKLDHGQNSPGSDDPDISHGALKRIAIRWNRIGALARLSPCGSISRQRDDGRALVRKAG
ncbi:MAG: hypothetical protein H6875_10800 [Hyphomicrobiaceae bacterium]|nr:hypothetical protein [Hyphomicrobiaceae bacterium]